MLDKIKARGYHYSTIGAVTISVSDMTVPESKNKLLSDTDLAVEKIEKMYRRGFISEDERYERVIEKRSEEHTSELQSRQHLVCRLLLEKKKTYTHNITPL